jgi:hypothetical protein
VWVGADDVQVDALRAALVAAEVATTAASISTAEAHARADVAEAAAAAARISGSTRERRDEPGESLRRASHALQEAQRLQQVVNHSAQATAALAGSWGSQTDSPAGAHNAVTAAAAAATPARTTPHAHAAAAAAVLMEWERQQRAAVPYGGSSLATFLPAVPTGSTSRWSPTGSAGGSSGGGSGGGSPEGSAAGSSQQSQQSEGGHATSGSTPEKPHNVAAMRQRVARLTHIVQSFQRPTGP